LGCEPYKITRDLVRIPVFPPQLSSFFFLVAVVKISLLHRGYPIGKTRVSQLWGKRTLDLVKISFHNWVTLALG
jgi:hypothetical protein